MRDKLSLSMIALCTLVLHVSPIDARDCSPERLSQVDAKLGKRFAKADINGDGLVSRDEVAQTRPQSPARFDALVTSKNKNGVTKSELIEHVRKRCAATKP
jgi:hypothetical protein